MQLNWYAIYTRGGQRGVTRCARLADDEIAADPVEKAAALIAMREGTFARVPMLRGFEWRKGRKVEKFEPILPGYVLIQTSDIRRTMRRLLSRPDFARYAVDVAGLVTPKEMSLIDVIEAIGTGVGDVVKPGTVAPGDMFEIKAGPLAGQTVAFARWGRQRGTWRMVVKTGATGLLSSVTIDPETAQRVRKIAADRRRG